jgi:sugar/nucleoside kinase (ribokinase family)
MDVKSRKISVLNFNTFAYPPPNYKPLYYQEGYFSFLEKQVIGAVQVLGANIDKLLDFLVKPSRNLNVVVTPDFFMDRLINLEDDPQQFASAVNAIVQRKGGSIDQISQTDQRGGNAVNVASALTALGTKVTPIVCTSKFGLEQIRFHFNKYNVDLSHVKTFSKASVTTALEFNTQNGKANVMLRDLGSLADFGPSDLTKEDYEVIENADYVCLFNWAGTRKYGTELAETVFQRAKTKGKGKTYFDTADPTSNNEKISNLMERVLKKNLVDVLSVNENEAVSYASLLSEEISEKRTKIDFNELALFSAQILAKQLSARIDLHTTKFSVTVTKEKTVFVPTFKIETKRATGAGDAWDAGNLLGDAHGLPDDCRLTLANAVSACYLSDKEGNHPTKQQLIDFLQKNKVLQE